MAIYCSNLFLYPSNTIDRASTVSGKSLNYMLPVNMQVGHGWKLKEHRPMTRMTHPKNRPILPMTHCLLCTVLRLAWWLVQNDQSTCEPCSRSFWMSNMWQPKLEIQIQIMRARAGRGIERLVNWGLKSWWSDDFHQKYTFKFVYALRLLSDRGMPWVWGSYA